MNWPNAKNLTLIFLVVLNILLGVLVYANRDDYRLTLEAEQAITKLLENNLITLNAPIPKDFSPLAQLLMTPGQTEIYLGIFYTETDARNLQITSEYNKTVYKKDSETLILQNGSAVYTRQLESGWESERQESVSIENPRQNLRNEAVQAELETFTEDDAIGICESFLADKTAVDFKFDRSVPTENGYCIEYRQSYNSALIFSNYFIFDVTPDGITRARCKYDQTVGLETGKSDIISADRALFVMMKYIVNEFENTAISIDQMDIVYIQPETSENANASLKASPHYRLYYSENDQPVLINAYTGVIFDNAY